MELSYPIIVSQGGYAMQNEEPRPAPAIRTVLSEFAGPGKYVVRVGDDLRDGGNLFAFDAAYRELAECKKDSDILRFVGRYGFLTDQRSRRQPRESFVASIQTMSSLIRAANQGSGGDRRPDWAALKKWVEQNRNRFRLSLQLIAPGDDDEGTAIFFQPRTLIEALFLQLFDDLTSHAQIRRCRNPGCGRWFKYGPGTNHRETALYHDRKCEKAHWYLRQKRGAK